jgi:hypothetical protein
MKIFLKATLIATSGIALYLMSVSTASAEVEAEPNNSFSSRQFIQSGTTTVEGSLSDGDVDFFSFSDLNVGEQFRASITSGTFDSILGLIDNFGNIIVTDDNDGSGSLSLLRVIVPVSGNLNLGLTGHNDLGLTGSHRESGSYILSLERLETILGVWEIEVEPNNSFATRQFLSSGTNTIEGLLNIGEVDFFTFSNLLPGSPFVSEIISSPFDSILGLLDDFGNIIVTDDDTGSGVLSELRGTVPVSGSLNFGVTGFRDFDLTGSHQYSGPYVLSLTATTVTATTVPEPSSTLGVLAFSAFSAGSLLKRKQQQKT